MSSNNGNNRTNGRRACGYIVDEEFIPDEYFPDTDIQDDQPSMTNWTQRTTNPADLEPIDNLQALVDRFRNARF